MLYANLQDLINRSQSSRDYFLSLPVDVQRALHEQDRYIHSAQGLHMQAGLVQRHMHAVENSEAGPFTTN